MRWYRGTLGRRVHDSPIRLDDALEALGEDGVMGRRLAEVPLASVVGTLGRSCDFDRDFRLVNSGLQDRWRRLANAVQAGFQPPPVQLIQLGDLYFVVDGHHRVSVAKTMGRATIVARVLRICTVAYAMCCLRMAHLPSKAAERRFLERVPLPIEMRSELWLDEPADWMRLADAAEAWALRRSLDGQELTDRHELAAAWWAEEVVPVLERARTACAGLDLRDVQLYVSALALRDGLGCENWPADLTDQMSCRMT
ncbi:MAG: hypothetical protein ACRDPT_08905 [Streptomycetales bacterium]